jgi:hypothetical protein
MDSEFDITYQLSTEVRRLCNRYLQTLRILLRLEIAVLKELIAAAQKMEKLADSTTPAYDSENQELIAIVANHASCLYRNVQEEMSREYQGPFTPEHAQQYYEAKLHAVRSLITSEIYALKINLDKYGYKRW